MNLLFQHTVFTMINNILNNVLEKNINFTALPPLPALSVNLPWVRGEGDTMQRSYLSG